MTQESYDSLAAWLAAQPETAQKLAKEFPIPLKIEVDGQLHWLIGYTEDDHLIITPIDPADFDAAKDAAVFLPADRARAARAAPPPPPQY